MENPYSTQYKNCRIQLKRELQHKKVVNLILYVKLDFHLGW